MQQSDLILVEGLLIKVVYDDHAPNGKPRVARGKLISTSESGATIETRNNVLILDISTILKVHTIKSEQEG